MRHAVVQVLAKAARLDLVAQIAVRRAHDADVDLHRGMTPDADHLLSLEHPQELRLQVRAQLAELVDEDGAAARRLEVAHAPLLRAGEGTLLVTEQQRLRERLGQRRGVDDHEGFSRPGAAGVQRARDLLLPGAGLALHQDCQRFGRDALQDREQLEHLRRAGHELAERA